MVRDVNDSADDAAEYEAIFGDTKAVGRVSKVNKAIIKSSFNEVIVIAQRVSKETGLSVGQVYDQWDGKRNRHNVRANKWNSYQVYHREHLAQERARLSQGKHVLLILCLSVLTHCLRYGAVRCLRKYTLIVPGFRTISLTIRII